MKVTISTSWLLVSIEENTSYSKMIRAFVEQNFKRVVNLSDTLIIFNEESEIRKKKQLLFWIGNVYKKLNDKSMASFVERIVKSDSVPIKIKFLKTTDKLSASLVLVIKKSYQNDNYVLISHQDILVFKHFLRIFFKDITFIDTKDGHFSIDISDRVSIKKIKELISRKKILNFQVNFKVDSFVKKLIENIEYKQREYKNNALKVEEIDIEVQRAFEFLKSTKDDDFNIVKKRYLILAKKYHPDSVFHSEELIDEYTRVFQKIQEAFSIIKGYYSGNKDE
jgi:hypothetical protein